MPSDYLLEIEGIKGESADDKHKGAIEVQSFSWGASNAGGHSTGGGGGAGKVSFQDLHFTTGVNKASPDIMLACANGKHIKKAVLIVRKQGEKQQVYYKLTMEDLLVSSYQSGGHDGGDSVPTDQFSLNFTKITFDYAPQKPDGSLDAYATTGWDVKKNLKV
jgi:type VI secretion system secreted protein Hcp